MYAFKILTKTSEEEEFSVIFDDEKRSGKLRFKIRAIFPRKNLSNCQKVLITLKINFQVAFPCISL